MVTPKNLQILSYAVGFTYIEEMMNNYLPSKEEKLLASFIFDIYQLPFTPNLIDQILFSNV